MQRSFANELLPDHILLFYTDYQPVELWVDAFYLSLADRIRVRSTRERLRTYRLVLLWTRSTDTFCFSLPPNGNHRPIKDIGIPTQSQNLFVPSAKKSPASL